MKAFLIKVCLLLTFAFSANIFINHHIWDKYLNLYLKKTPTFKTVLLSDSHGAVLREEVSSVGISNLSHSGDSYIDMERIISQLVKVKKPDTVFISADRHTLSSYRDIFNNNDRSSSFSPQSGYDSFYAFLKNKYIVSYVSILNGKHRDLIYIYIKAKLRSMLNISSSKTASKEKWDETPKAERAKAIEHRANHQFNARTHSIKQEESLRRIITLCEKNKIKIIGIMFPVTQEYLEQIEYNDFGASKILRENKIEVYDFSEIFDEPNLFSDQDHMSPKGVNVFIEKYLRDIVSPAKGKTVMEQSQIEQAVN